MSTKAQTLFSLIDQFQEIKILDLVYFTVEQWRYNENLCLKQVQKKLGDINDFIVRSSAKSEDQLEQSNAGKYESILNVSYDNLSEAIEKVISSFGINMTHDDEVLIQPMLKQVAMSGVFFTRDPNTGAPYYIINYEVNGDTSAVTSGNGFNLESCIIARSSEVIHEKKFQKLIEMSEKLEEKLAQSSLDIEFAFDQEEKLYLLQVRPLIIPDYNNSINQKDVLKIISNKIENISLSHPYLHGRKTILGVMPDWNPAEIIGIRPKPLALSLYKELITDSIWAYQRDNYGYKNLRSFPLLIDLMGLPYIDVRVSFNSFIPKDLDPQLASRLVDYYLDRLESEPHLHDKIEFEIAFSCYTFDLQNQTKKLIQHGFSEKEIFMIEDSLRKLTNNIIHNDNGLWVKDIQKINELQKRHELIFYNNSFDELTKIYWLIEDCKRYGTLPFAGLARAGFIAVQILNSMVTVGAITSVQKSDFLSSLDSVSSQMSRDLHQIDKNHFLKKYGHLRPGTYDILSPRYDEKPELYFDWDKIKNKEIPPKNDFQLNFNQMVEIESLLDKHQLDHDVIGLFKFMKSAIEGREYAKFIFTKTLSDILDLLKSFSLKHGLDISDTAFLNIQSILNMQSSSWGVLSEIKNSIQSGKEKFNITSQIVLPSLIIKSSDIYSFKLPENKPNFVTRKFVTAKIVHELDNMINLSGAIVFIPSADPGFDWIFTHDIAGFVTCYGGVNSHMAIRASELGLPAVIGSGEKLYKQWSAATRLHIDCMNQFVRILH